MRVEDLERIGQRHLLFVGPDRNEIGRLDGHFGKIQRHRHGRGVPGSGLGTGKGLAIRIPQLDHHAVFEAQARHLNRGCAGVAAGSRGDGREQAVYWRAGDAERLGEELEEARVVHAEVVCPGAGSWNQHVERPVRSVQRAVPVCVPEYGEVPEPAKQPPFRGGAG